MNRLINDSEIVTVVRNYRYINDILEYGMESGDAVNSGSASKLFDLNLISEEELEAIENENNIKVYEQVMSRLRWIFDSVCSGCELCSINTGCSNSCRMISKKVEAVDNNWWAEIHGGCAQPKGNWLIVPLVCAKRQL